MNKKVVWKRASRNDGLKEIEKQKASKNPNKKTEMRKVEKSAENQLCRRK